MVELITPGSGAGSFLYQILLTDIAGRQRMPRGGPYLNNNNIEGVRIWIDEGAPLAVE